MSTFRRAPVQLSPLERAALEGALSRHEPELLARLDLGGTVSEVQQPFFGGHRLLELETISPVTVWRVALSSSREVLPLTGSLSNWNLLVEADPPPNLVSAEQRVVYVNFCDAWTSARGDWELQVEGFADLPLGEDMHPAERDLMEQLEASLGDAITPPRYEETSSGYLLVRWILVDRQLLCRVLEVTSDGRVHRTDEVYDADLPVPTGQVWGSTDGGPVPLS
ncbi:MAG: hypothetical protein VX938_13715, partial [Myxococcota bacterium]|nr:hypothetical protein [Myxococcota bacterium]